MRAALPLDEQKRLEIIEKLELLTNKPDSPLLEIVRSAAAFCHLPIAAVSIVAEEHQFLKAQVGFSVCSTHRDEAFCAHAILENTPMLVENALEDPRFSDNPLVNENPGLRCYLGVPLKVQGHAVGTLFVAGTEPKVFSEAEIQLMINLADMCERILTKISTRDAKRKKNAEVMQKFRI